MNIFVKLTYMYKGIYCLGFSWELCEVKQAQRFTQSLKKQVKYIYIYILLLNYFISYAHIYGLHGCHKTHDQNGSPWTSCHSTFLVLTLHMFIL